jgi:hypothetical protein
MPGTSERMAAVAPGNDLHEAVPTKGFVLIGVAIASGWPLVLLITDVSGLNITNTRDDAVNIVVKWLVVAGLCMITFLAQRRPPWEFGIRAGRDCWYCPQRSCQSHRDDVAVGGRITGNRRGVCESARGTSRDGRDL